LVTVVALWLEVWLEPNDEGVAAQVEVDVEVEDVAELVAVDELDDRELEAVVRTEVAAAALSAMLLPSPRNAATLRAAAATRDRAAAWGRRRLDVGRRTGRCVRSARSISRSLRSALSDEECGRPLNRACEETRNHL
jgi:hypothetical protein